MTVNLKEFWKMQPAQDGRTWFTMEEVADKTHVVELFGVIGDWEVDPIELVNQLKAIDGEGVKIELRIDSPGGSVPGGVLLMSCIAEMKATVVAKIWGQAFSMASLIPVACDEVHIAKDAYMMIHNPRGLGYGTAQEVMAAAKYLEKIREQAADRYAERTEVAGHSRDEVLEAMDATTYFTALEAIEFGLADALIETTGNSQMMTDPEFAAVMLGDEIPDEVKDHFIMKDEAAEEGEAPEVEAVEAVEVIEEAPEMIAFELNINGETFSMSASAEVAESLEGAGELIAKPEDQAPEMSVADEEDPVVAALKSGAESAPVMTARNESSEAGQSKRERKTPPARIAGMNRNFGQI